METQAAIAYRAAQERAARQLRQIEALLDAHAKRQAKAPTNWGYVGDIHSVVRELSEVIESMGGTEPVEAAGGKECDSQ